MSSPYKEYSEPKAIDFHIDWRCKKCLAYEHTPQYHITPTNQEYLAVRCSCCGFIEMMKTADDPSNIVKTEVNNGNF